MNKTNAFLLTSLALTCLTTACSDETSHKTANNPVPLEEKPHTTISHAEMSVHQKSIDAHSSSVSSKITGSDIGRPADDLPPAITRTEPQLVKVDLYTEELIAEMMPEVTYQYWTYNGKVPAPFIRAREGDTVEIKLRHGNPVAKESGHSEHSSAQHAAAGHSTHSIDLHAVVAPGGGAPLMQVSQGEEKSFQFKATRPGIYVYHCASPHIPSHIANGMYGMILVEPAGGLAKVDREFYLMQGEFYTSGKFGTKGLQALDKHKLLTEQPEYFLFNGRVNALSGEKALKAKVGEKLRLFVGVGGHIASNFHIIGAVFDALYSQGAITNPPLKNVQTTLIAAGSAVMIEFTIDVPGKYLLVDHSLSRAVDKGALAELVVEDK